MRYRSSLGVRGLRPTSTVTAVDELLQIAVDGGNLRERWNYRLGTLLDHSKIIPMTIVGQGLSQLPHLANLAINSHYSGGWPILAAQVGGLLAGYAGTFFAALEAEDYVKEYEWRQQDVSDMLARGTHLSRTAPGGAPALSELDEDPLPVDPTDRWIAIHRQAIEAGAKIDEAVRKANKAVYGDERGRYGKHAQPQPSPSL